MSRIRLVFAWLLLLALPLQGLAASSMLYCGTTQAAGQHMHAAAQEAAPAAAGHSHAGDGHAHEAPAAGHDHPKQIPDEGHGCSVCAACGHGVALAETPHAIEGMPTPQSRSEFSASDFLSRPSPVPDKPPRA